MGVYAVMAPLELTRRRVLALGGTAIAGGAGIATLGGSAEAQSSIEYGTYSVADQTHEQTGDVTDVRLSARAIWEYSSSHVPDTVELSLNVGDAETNVYPIALRNIDTGLTESESGTDTLEASLMNSPTWSLHQFQPHQEGVESLSHTVYTTLQLRVIRESEVVTEAQVADSFTLTVEDGIVTASGQLGGEGSTELVTD